MSLNAVAKPPVLPNGHHLIRCPSKIAKFSIARQLDYTAMFQVTEINSLAELVRFHDVWDILMAQTPGATFFQSLKWLEIYWKFYGENTAGGQPSGRLKVLVVEDQSKTIGILPLVIVTEPFRVGPLRVLGYPLAGWGSFYGPIGPSAAATLAAGLKHIHQTSRDWDLLDLRWVDADLDGGATLQALQAAGFSAQNQVWHTSAQIELAEGWNNYWQNRKPNWRSNVRRCRRLLERRGIVEHIRYRPGGAAAGDCDPRWDWYDACVDLANRSWQGSSSTGTTMSHESIRDYLRATHAAAVEVGAVDVNLLTVDNQPVAFSYNYHFRGSMYGLRAGYDPEFAHEGPGNVLMSLMIEDGCRRGDWLIDLGPNYLDCKRQWMTRLHPAWHFTHFHPANVRAQALRLKRIVRRWLGSCQPASVIPSKRVWKR